MDTRYYDKIVFLLHFLRDVYRLRIDIEVTYRYMMSLSNITMMCSGNVAQCKTSCYGDTYFQCRIISDKDENVINNDKHVLLHLSKRSDKLYGKIVFNRDN